MNFINNRNWLRQHFRSIAEVVREWEEKEPTGTVLVEPAKTGELTLKIEEVGKWKYLHSKYDPLKETERLLKSYHSEHKTPVLFFGIGLGYHIDAFIEQNPGVKVALYEPNEEVLLAYLKRVDLRKYPENDVYLLTTQLTEEELAILLTRTRNKLQILPLPFYEKSQQKKLDEVKARVVEGLKEKRSSLAVHIAFQRLWTTNAIRNFPTVLRTPNLLLQKNKEKFKEQTALIVAAGPSLNYEIEHLRYIKERNLAYIFAVGSAVNALIEHGIYPHAVFSYDPSELQYKVHEKLREKNILDVPLIFGSSLSHTALEKFQGDQYHFLLSQDRFSAHLLEETYNEAHVNDAPSIAVVLLQLLIRLAFKQIVFVGQNLGYKEDKRYATGIAYDFVESTISETEQENALEVLSVTGEKIATEEGFNRMREQLEMYINSSNGSSFINTTVDGAAIAGTTYERLASLIDRKVFVPIQPTDFFDVSTTYSVNQVVSKFKKLLISEQQLIKGIQETQKQLQAIQKLYELRKVSRLETAFGKLDEVYQQIDQNPFYQAIIHPMILVQHGELTGALYEIRESLDAKKKAEVIMQSFAVYLAEIEHHQAYVKPLLVSVLREITEGEEE